MLGTIHMHTPTDISLPGKCTCLYFAMSFCVYIIWFQLILPPRSGVTMFSVRFHRVRCVRRGTKRGSCIPIVMLITCWKPLCEFSLKISDVFFRGQTLFWPYLWNGWSDWCETKRKFISWILDIPCDLDLWPHSWPWRWSYQGHLSK